MGPDPKASVNAKKNGFFTRFTFGPQIFFSPFFFLSFKGGFKCENLNY